VTPRSPDILDLAPARMGTRTTRRFRRANSRTSIGDMTAAEVGCGVGADLLRADRARRAPRGASNPTPTFVDALSTRFVPCAGLSVIELGATTLPLTTGSVDFLFSDLTRPGARSL
jgi:hypothetical protein